MEQAKYITFTVPGRIGGWSRAARGGKVTFTPAKMRVDQGIIRHFASEAMKGLALFQGAVQLDISILKLIPKSWTKTQRAQAYWVTGTPDCSNLLKNVEDAMNRVVYLDDAQIADLHVSRRYTDEGECIRVIVSHLERPGAP